jgi:hypothetical protein
MFKMPSIPKKKLDVQKLIRHLNELENQMNRVRARLLVILLELTSDHPMLE